MQKYVKLIVLRNKKIKMKRIKIYKKTPKNQFKPISSHFQTILR